MKKVIRLTESDLTHIVKRVIKEEQDRTTAIEATRSFEQPKVEEKFDVLYDKLTPNQKNALQTVINNLRITPQDSAKIIHDKVEAKTDAANQSLNLGGLLL